MSEHVKEPGCFTVHDDDRDWCLCGWSERVVEIPYDRREDAAWDYDERVRGVAGGRE